jgi:hypothetical protein
VRSDFEYFGGIEEVVCRSLVALFLKIPKVKSGSMPCLFTKARKKERKKRKRMNKTNQTKKKFKKIRKERSSRMQSHLQ